jgi:uncharacterized protein
MLYRKMEKTGDELSVLGFGCMRLPQKKGQPGSGKIDEERATRQIRYAIDQGVNYIDTAMNYHMGKSEPFLGNALASGYRERVYLATKLLPHWVKTRADMDKLLDSQLDRLKTDHIDYYLLHGLSGFLWKKMVDLDVLDFLDKAKQNGRIRHAGFSFHGDGDSFKAIVDGYDWEFCQIQYNFLDQQHQAGTEGLKYAAAKGLGVVVMEPLRGGTLTKKLAELDSIWDQADRKRTPAEWGLRWVWNHPEVTVVLSGMNDEKHIEENIRIANEAYPESLSERELNLVSRVEETYRKLMKAGCTGCRYCMPCPSGVDIPASFEQYNRMKVFGDTLFARFWYMAMAAGALSGAPSLASMCKDCGKCVELCPQHLPIPDLLKDVANEFEKWWLKPAIWAFNQFSTIQRRKTMKKARRKMRNSGVRLKY